MSATMKALLYEGPEQMHLRDVPLPDLKQDEVLIEVAYAGICGSELSGYLGKNSLRKPPLIMGHEFSGRIVKLGDKALSCKVGDRVTVNPLISCRNCSDCLSGRAQLCAQRRLLGAHLPGAYAQYIAVPVSSVFPLPEQVSLQQAALTEPLACAVHIARLARFNPTDRLFIAGAGPIGLLTLLAAKRFGVETIVVQDINANRLEIVSALGGRPVHADEPLDGQPFTVSVDAVGLGITRKLCAERARPGGRVIFSGLHDESSELPVNLAVRNELTLQGAFAYAPSDFETALQWIAEGRIHLDKWMKSAPLAEGKACFDLLLSSPGSMVKILLAVK